MATPVPYNPVPSVTPRDIPTPTEHEDTPLAAFGGLTAQAISTLGQTTEGAGKEIFARGLAMQQLNREAAANEATANWTTQAGVSLENFQSLRGKAAVDGHDAFVAGLNSSREDAKADLRDPYSQLLFDQETRRMQSYLTMSAARHAADQNTAYVLGALKASNDASDVRTLGDPTNEPAFQADLERKRKNIDQEAIIKGWSPQEKEDSWASLKNDSYAARFQSLAKTQPFTARQMADNAITAGDLTGKAAKDTLDYINKLRASVGARQEASLIHAGDNLKFGENILPYERAKAGITTVEGGNYSKIITIKDPDTGKLVDIIGAYQVKQTKLAPWLKEAGMPNMSEAEFVKNHDAQDQLFRFKFVEQFQNEGGSFNAAAKKWFTGSFKPREGAEDAFHTTVPVYLARANAGLARSASITELQSLGDRRAEQLAPDDPIFHDQLLNHIESIRQKDERVQKVKEQENYATVYDAFHKEITDNKVVVDFDKLTHSSPEVESAYHAMSAQDQDKLQKNVIAVNNALTKQTNMETFKYALGLAHGDTDAREKFMSLNPWHMDLSPNDMIRVDNLQRKLASGGDVKMKNVLDQVRPQLDAAGVERWDQKSQAQFRGALITAVLDWNQENQGKTMQPEQLKTLTNELLSNQTSPNFWYGKDLLFRLPLPQELVDRARKENPDVSDAELERMRQEHVRQQLRQLQETKASKVEASR